MTNWGAALLAGFVYLGLRRPRAKSHYAVVGILMTLVILLLVAVRQHTP
jgi:hypothetical protein